MKFKFNGGRGAVLCGKCGVILYEGSNIPQYIIDAAKNGTLYDLPDVYCEDNCERSNRIFASLNKNDSN